MTFDVQIVELWAEKIALEVAPGEAELAAMYAHAFVAGGSRRADLFRRAPGGPPGAFGPAGVPALTPLVLQAVQDYAPGLLVVLSSGYAERAVRVIRDLLGIRDSLASKGSKSSSGKAAPASPLAPVKDFMDTLTRELQAANLSREQSEVIAYRVLRAMLEEPAEAARFVQHVAAVR
ncbi:MAG: hypothetical protein QN174_03180 [Armatimonadota bacterium]|nr:hypothetical protein [Armatimonadota bacterium]MDR7421603.1 hypothetical protein [Armatimonadota bacterium]MDR7455374.1 hypothetical protein [Armatimonadota bacterium]MDR7456013.1 hypothetical protein [Armatimonadota bacterium]MDR7495950.1 hypothetical protein [Armatimonadota bacterium]